MHDVDEIYFLDVIPIVNDRRLFLELHQKSEMVSLAEAQYYEINSSDSM